MTSDQKRYVRNRSGGPAFLKGHGVVPAGETVEAKSSDGLDAAIEARVFEAADKPQENPEPKAAATGRKQTTTEKENGS